MQLRCFFGGHDWAEDCEKCANCKKTRPDAHSWDGCACSKCKVTRDEEHRWSGCKCSQCGIIRDEAHDWARDCEKCAKCGKTRQAAHAWNGCKCSSCGKTRNENHSWDGCKCSACGRTRDQDHDFGATSTVCVKCRKDLLPPDPTMDQMEAMMNAQAWVWRSELDESMQFIFNNGKISGIWLSNFPTNAPRRTVLHLFCQKEQSRVPANEAMIERVVDRIYDDRYVIERNATKGGFNVLVR
jgi:hypothetical protein